jgi:hydrogenase maturation factor HypF (carbamoyltransferase family)
METRQTVEIRVRGTVQGVGFRPTVWRLARAEGLFGEVLNDGRGVLIRTTGNAGAIARFLERLYTEAPPLSHIEGVHTQRLTYVWDFADFHIVESVGGKNYTASRPMQRFARPVARKSWMQAKDDMVMHLQIARIAVLASPS